MKKVSLLILLIVVASLAAAAIPTKMMRLTIINKSGDDVYIKLEGSTVTEAYYYLTIPAGDRDLPTVKVFTIWADIYKRTTWQCSGLRSSGQLFVDGNIRLTFTPCGEMNCGKWLDWGRPAGWWVNRRCGGQPYAGPDGVPGTADDWTFTWKRHAGEPRMEKVTYFRILYGPGRPNWYFAYLYTGFLNYGCGTWYYRIRNYRLPYGCQWRYQY